MLPQVKPRSEILEYGLLPISILLPRLDSTKSLVELHTKLLAAGEATDEGESVIPVSSLSELLSATEGYAQVLIETFEAVSPDDSPYWENQTGALHVSVQQLSLFLFAQLYGREAVRHESTANDHWPTESPHAAECSSPRLGWKSSTPGTPKRQQLAQYVAQRRQYLFAYGDFLRRNLKKVVMLAMDQFPAEPHDQVRIKSAELDRLAFILQVVRPAATLHQTSPRNPSEEDTISSMLEFFKQSPTAKLDDVLNWIQDHWIEESMDSPRAMALANGSTGVKVNRSIGLVGTSGLVDDHSIKGVHRGTVVRGEHDFPTGELHIADCHDAVIYVLAPLRHCLVIGCSECTVIVGAVGSMLRVEGCDKLQVISACVQLVISTCHDCTFWLGINRSPVLIGDNRFITLAPYNTRYERLPVHLREAGVRSDLPNQWSAPIVLKPKERRLSVGSVPDSPRWFTSGSSDKAAGGGSEARGPVTFMPPEDFMPFVVPFKGGQGMLAGGAGSQVSTKWLTAASSGSSSNSYPFPLPPEYEAALRSKFTFVSELRSKIKAAVLDEGRRRELQAVIQLHFKDWLSSSNNIRQVYDLSKLEGDESLTPH